MSGWLQEWGRLINIQRRRLGGRTLYRHEEYNTTKRWTESRVLSLQLLFWDLLGASTEVGSAHTRPEDVVPMDEEWLTEVVLDTGMLHPKG